MSIRDLLLESNSINTAVTQGHLTPNKINLMIFECDPDYSNDYSLVNNTLA